jgi:hypothetical protein
VSKARFILRKIRGSKSLGASEATRYIARSKLHAEREGNSLRLLFSDSHDALSHWQADRLLSGGSHRLAKDDILHYVLSVQDAGDFKRLGASDDERKDFLREAVRAALREAEKELKVLRLHWTAGIHLNTDNPHAHIVISRHAIDSETENLRRIGKLPLPLVPHNEKQQDGSKTFLQGKILGVFTKEIDARQREIELLHAKELAAAKVIPDKSRTDFERANTTHSEPHLDWQELNKNDFNRDSFPDSQTREVQSLAAETETRAVEITKAQAHEGLTSDKDTVLPERALSRTRETHNNRGLTR